MDEWYIIYCLMVMLLLKWNRGGIYGFVEVSFCGYGYSYCIFLIFFLLYFLFFNFVLYMVSGEGFVGEFCLNWIRIVMVFLLMVYY